MKTITNQSPSQRQSNSEQQDKWSELAELISQSLITRIGVPRFELWFDHPDCIRIEDRRVLITGSSPFSLQRLQNTFATDIREIVKLVCGPQFQVVYQADDAIGQNATDQDEADVEPSPANGLLVIHSNGDSSSDEPDNSQQSVSSAPRSDSPAPQTFKRRNLSLSTFCFGKENALAEAAVDQVIRQPGKYSPLYVYGPTGCGKSHFLEGLASDFRRRTRKSRSVYLSSEEFTGSFIGSLRGSGLPMFRRKYRDLDFLAIDDVQFFEGKRATIGEFQSTIDNLLRMGKQVVVSSDRPPAELSGVSPDLAARLTAGLICPLNCVELPGRLSIAQSFCRERGYRFAPAVLELVCEKISGDIRQLSGALNRLHVASIVSGKPITVGAANDVLVDLFAVSGATTSLMRIEKAVCELCNVQSAELKSSSRKKRICTARMLAMYLAREHTNNAFSEIGDYFGGRSHSTVIAAQKKVAGWIRDDLRIDLPHAAYEAGDIVKRIKSNLRVS